MGRTFSFFRRNLGNIFYCDREFIMSVVHDGTNHISEEVTKHVAHCCRKGRGYSPCITETKIALMYFQVIESQKAVERARSARENKAHQTPKS